MDYVVYGTGYGATLMLLGYAVRTWGPEWRYRDEDPFDRAQVRMARSAWTRFTNGLGAVIATCGAALILVTFLMMLVNPGDTIGVTVSLGASALVLIAVAVWSWMYWDRFGSYGVLPKTQTVAGPAPLRYDDRRQPASSGSDEDASRAGTDDDDIVDEDEFFDEEEADEEAGTPDESDETVLDADTDDFDARYTKFELHHPDADADDLEERYARATAMQEDTGGDQPVDADDLSARAAKFEQHHPGPEGYEDALDDSSADVTGTPASTAGELAVPETPEGEDVERDAPPVVDESTDDIQDTIVPVIEPDATVRPIEPDAEPRQERGGRDEALRRLRDRRAQRSQRPDDDA